MDIKPIRSETEYDAALEEIDRLFDAEAGTPDADRRDVLVTLVEQYEAIQYPLPKPSPVAAIEHALEARGWTRKELEPYIGSRSRVYEIMSRKRPLTLPMMRRLHEALRIPLDILAQPYELAPGPAP